MRIILAHDRTRKGKVVKRGFHILMVMAAIMPWCASNSAETLGRLFFTPAQRNTLDAGKQLAKPRQAAPNGPQAATLNGVVTRSDGVPTVWVNGHAVGGGTSAVNASPSASDPAAARVELRGARNPVRLRVGQSFDRSTGKVVESYESTTVNTKQSESEPTQRKPVDRRSGVSRLRDRTAETADQDSDRPSND